MELLFEWFKKVVNDLIECSDQEKNDIETKINWEKSFECSELDYCLQMQTINSIHPSFHQAHLPDAHFIKRFIPDGKIKEGVSLLADQILS